VVAPAPTASPQQSTVLQCQNCGAALRVAAHAMTTVCPYCASPSVVARPPSPDHAAPLFVVPFVFGRDVALDTVKRWIKKARGMFTHSGLRRAKVDDVRGVYMPAFLYGAVAWSDWSASIGENYTETETYTTTNEKGETVTQTRTVVRTEWRDLAGRHATYVRDVLVTASASVGNLELEAIEPYDLRAIRRFVPAAVAGWFAEEPSLPIAQCAQLARGEAMQHVGRDLAAFMPGDHCQGLQHSTRFEHEVLDPVLVPVWVLAVRYDPKKPMLRVLVNGQTGRVLGRAPLSWPRIVLGIVLLLLVVGGIAFAIWWANGGMN
jgi:hypothetical protein